MKQLLVLVFLFAQISMFGQPASLPIYYQSNYLRIVQPNSSLKLDTLMNPYTGGMNCPTFFNIDMNGDGIGDLFVFDRDNNENQFTLYMAKARNSIVYKFSPYYESAFPTDMNSWAGFYDYNKDGFLDLFTHTQAAVNSTGIKTYKNTSYIDPVSKKFKLRFTPFSDTLFCYNALNQPQQVNIPYVANPCFADIDNDGFMDILTYEQDLTSLYWYRNQGTRANGNPRDSLKFYLTDQCWGKFSENGPHYYKPLNCLEFNAYDPVKHKNGGAHFNTSIALIDADGDGDLDLLVGDGGNDTLTLLVNGKTKNKNHRDTMTNLPNTNKNNYPFDVPAIIHTLPTPSITDIDNDGIKDLVVAPGMPSDKDSVDVSHQNNIWYYKNNGDTVTPIFNGEPQKDFLENTMVDWGVNSAPCFIDVDKDGRKDLLVAVRDGGGKNGNNSHIVLYLNKAGAKAGSKPYMIYQSADYMGLSTFPTSIRRPVPCGYLNGKDSKTDLIMGNDSGRVMYFKDQSTGTNPANFVLVQSSLKYLVGGNLVPIDVGNNSSPTSVDINKDGKTDLLIGANDGRISYYRCLGYGPSPDFIPYFQLVTNTFGGINSAPLSDIETAPCVADLNRDGKPDLIVGDFYGQLLCYLDFDTVSTLTPLNISLVYDYRTQQRYNYKLFSTDVKPAIAYLDNDSIPDIMLGCRRGGLFFLGSQNDSAEMIDRSGIEQALIPNPPDINLFPNPAKDYIVLQYSNNTSVNKATIRIMDMLGRSMATVPCTLVPGKGTEQVSTMNLPDGFYILNLMDGDQVIRNAKFIINR